MGESRNLGHWVYAPLDGIFQASGAWHLAYGATRASAAETGACRLAQRHAHHGPGRYADHALLEEGAGRSRGDASTAARPTGPNMSGRNAS